MDLRSGVPGLEWPAVVAPRAAAFYAAWRQLEDSQWLSAPEMVQRQKRQLMHRLRFSAQHMPEIRRLITQWPWQDSSWSLPALMRELPLLTRRSLQTRPDTYFMAPPASHGKVTELKTSGSSGEPVAVQATAQVFQLRAALTLRGHLWHGLNFKSSFAAIRGGIRERRDNPSFDAPQWGGMVAALCQTGKSHALDIATPVAEQVMWLKARRPGVLLSLPSNLEVLLESLPQGWPELTHVLTISETLSPELRQRLQSQWGCQVRDKYSSEELGSIAIECEHGNYHVSEHLIVEVLREDGAPCDPGEIGRVVVTDTWNFATHMVRYDIRDYAQAGSVCACGRGLTVLSRIMGRVRNLMTLPDGRTFWPLFGMRKFGELAPIHQMQFVQTHLDALLIRYVCERPLTESERLAVSSRVCAMIEYPLRISFERSMSPLNAGTGFKFEEFKSLVHRETQGSIFSSNPS